MPAKRATLDTAKSRRDFIKSTAVLAAGYTGSSAAGAQAPRERLAIAGGSKSVLHPHFDAARWPLYGEPEEQAVLKLLHQPSYDPLAALEEKWCSQFQSPHARAFCNGTSALTSMFFALDLEPGSEVMVPSYTFFASIVPMRHFGLVPVFVDIDPQTLNFDLADAQKRLTPRTRAVLPVHWFGNPCDMDDICSWAGEKDIIVLEDVAHAHGVTLQGKPLGNWGRMGIFSFQTSKPLPTLEGGMGVYQHKEDFDRATSFGHYALCQGDYEGYRGTGLGLKFRMHPFAAALAISQLDTLSDRNSRGVTQVRSLNDRLIELPGLADQRTRPDCQRLYYSRNMLFLDEKAAGMSRQACVDALRAEGVQATAYSYPLQHTMRIYSEAQWWHHKPELPDLPGSDEANATAIALPYFTSEQPELVDQYVAAFEKVWAHRRELS